MTTAVLDIHSLEPGLSEAAGNMADGVAETGPRMSFATPELLWEVLTAERWALLKAIAGVGPVSIAEVAVRADRGETAVRRDVDALLQAGVLDPVEDGLMEFPYDTVKVELLLRAG